jgi:TPR repeat protein
METRFSFLEGALSPLDLFQKKQDPEQLYHSGLEWLWGLKDHRVSWPEGVEKITAAAALGHPIALCYTAFIASFENERSPLQPAVEKSVRKGLKQLGLRPTLRDSPHARNILGFLWEKGIIVPKNRNRAFSSYKKAAKEGHAEAQFNYALCLEEKGDLTKAVKYYLRSASQGHVLAENTLGGLYWEGGAGERNKEKAYMYYKHASLRGYGLSSYNLGCLYEKGEGAERDLKRARYFYILGREQGDFFCQIALEKGEARPPSDPLIHLAEPAPLGHI